MKKFIISTIIVIRTASLLLFAAPISVSETNTAGGYGYGYVR